MRGARRDCRQTASAFLHNFSEFVPLYEGEGDSELSLSRASVSLLVALLENVERDTDAEVLRRRLLGVYFLVQRDSTGGLQDLCQGFGEQCATIRHTASGELRNIVLTLQDALGL